MPSPSGKVPDPLAEFATVVDGDAVTCVAAGAKDCEVDEEETESGLNETVVVPQLERIAAKPEKIKPRITVM